MQATTALIFLLLAIEAQCQFYTSFDPLGEGFTYETVGHAYTWGNSFTTPAFLPDGRVVSMACSTNVLFVFSATQDIVENGTPLRSVTTVNLPYGGCSIFNGPGGYLYYTAWQRGLIKIDPVTFQEVPIAGSIGGQVGAYAAYGTAVDPQNTNHLFYSAVYSIQVLDTTTNTVFDFEYDGKGQYVVDALVFNGDGSLIFLADTSNFRLVVLDRNGNTVATSPVPYLDGLAFHSATNSLFAISNDGGVYRIRLSDYAVTTFASGAARGDLGTVGSDTCLYAAYAYGFRYNDGTWNPSDSSLIKICPSFTVPAGVSTGSCSDQNCCNARANPNKSTGNGYLEYKPSCLNGGLNCVSHTGCALCHLGTIPSNPTNRPICNETLVGPTIPCTTNACCASRSTPNPTTGYGNYQFVSGCYNGGTFCVYKTGCQNCFNTASGAVNSLGLPNCN